MLSLCLSRACLGKMTIFSINWRVSLPDWLMPVFFSSCLSIACLGKPSFFLERAMRFPLIRKNRSKIGLNSYEMDLF
eukprot:COSAG06_NODE_3190_length_5707_cov_57.591655_3_plen_77_part_00